MADTGDYDIWMMNSRGNHKSRDHLWLDPDTDPEFWNFSFQEIGEYDLPGCLDFLFSNRKESKFKVIILGHSQGTTIATYTLAEKHPIMNSKVSLFIAIAPAVFFTYSDEPVFR